MVKRKKKSINPNDTKESPVEKKGKRNSNVVNRSAAEEQGENSNRFAILADAEDDQVSSQPMEIPADNNDVADSGNNQDDGPPANPHPTKQKLPPLVVKSVPLDKIMRTMKAINVTAEYQLTRMGIKVVTSTREEYNKAKTYLSKASVQFYTHDVAAEKPFKAVVRGLPTMSTEDIEEELREGYKLHPLAVFPMNRRDQSNPYRDCLYLVHFAKGSTTLGTLKAIRSINNVIVKWEAYKGPNRSVTQCMRCLKFGHGTRNCHLKPKCNFCSQQHLTEHCVYEGACAYKCANCNGNHRSTDKACTKREEYRTIRMKATTRNQPDHDKKKKQERINLDLFPDLPLPRPRPIPDLPPLLHPNQQQTGDPPANSAPPGFSSYQTNPSPNQCFSEANQHDNRQNMDQPMDPMSHTIAQLATLVAELQKMMMQMMHFFTQISIHHGHPNP